MYHFKSSLNQLLSNTFCSILQTHCIMTCTRWFLCKNSSSKHYILGNTRHLPRCNKKHLATNRRGLCHASSHNQRKTNRNCCSACGWCLSSAQKKKPCKQEGSITFIGTLWGSLIVCTAMQTNNFVHYNKFSNAAWIKYKDVCLLSIKGDTLMNL